MSLYTVYHSAEFFKSCDNFSNFRNTKDTLGSIITELIQRKLDIYI